MLTEAHESDEYMIDLWHKSTFISIQLTTPVYLNDTKILVTLPDIF